MADFRINVIVDPRRARPGIDEVRAELDSLDDAGSRINDNLGNLARDLDLPGEAVSDLTNDLVDGFDLATEATEALDAANDSVIGTVSDTAQAVEAVGTAAEAVVDTGDGFDDLRRRMAAISEQAENLAGGLGNSGDAANDAVAGLARSSGLLRGLLLTLGAIAAAIVAVAAAAILTQDKTKEAFGELGTDILDLGRATLAALREVLGPVDDFLIDAINSARAGVSTLTDEILRLGGVTDFVTTRQRLYNEAFAEAQELSEGFGQTAITSINALTVSLLNTEAQLGLTTGELIRFNAELRISEASDSIFDGYSEALRDLQEDLEDGTIKQFQYNAAVKALNEGLEDNLEVFDEAAAAARRYADELAIATEQQERIADAFATFNSLQSEESIFQKQIDDLVFLRDTGEITMSEFVDSTIEALSRIPQEAELPFTELQQIAEQGARSLQGVFADFLFDPFETGLDGLVVGFAEAIRRMTSDALAAQLFEALFGGIQGQSGGPSGLGGFFAAAFGGGFGSGGTPGFQNGGEFTVGGSGGPDSQLVMFRASPMENVTITPPGQAVGGQQTVAAPDVNVTMVNVTDPSDLPAAMESPEGDRVFLNFISRKRLAINQQLGNR